MSNNQILDCYNIENFYHMTHINNLESILKHGLYAHNNPYKKVDISDCDVNIRRVKREPIHNKSVHDYVPFYFNPKNHMLSARRNIQDKIVILVIKKDIILNKDALFTDCNASTDSVKFYNDLNNLNKLDFNCIYDNGYYLKHHNGAKTRMAEVLVPNYVSTNKIEAIICNNFELKNKIHHINTIVEKSFYF